MKDPAVGRSRAERAFGPDKAKESTAKKKKGPKLPAMIQQMFKLMAELRGKGYDWKKCLKPCQEIDPKLTNKAFDSLIRRYNHHQKKTNLGQVD